MENIFFEKLIGIIFVLFGMLSFRFVLNHPGKGFLKDSFNFKGFFGALTIIALGIVIIIGKWHILR
jgi:hypothetical protein